MRPTPCWRLLSAIVLFAMLASACSRQPPGGEVVLGGDQTGGVSGLDAGTTDLGTIDPGTAGDLGGTALDGSAGGTGADTGGSLGAAGGAAGGAGGTQSTGTTASSGQGGSSQGGSTSSGGGTGGSAASGPVPGIKGRTVNVVFHTQMSDCPNNPATASNPSPENYAKTRKVITEYVKFFNRFVLKEFDWTLTYKIVDDGGQYCPERQRAAALKIVKEIKPFAVLGYSISPQGPIVADVVTRAGIRHIGVNWSSFADLRARAPYAWTINGVAEKGLEMLVGYMDRRLKGTQFPRGGPAGNAAEDRVYGLVATDSRDGKALATSTVKRLQARGFKLTQVYLISPDPGVAAQQSTTVVTQMNQDGVNSLVWGLDPAGYVAGVALTNTMAGQNFLPDVLIGTYGVAFFDQLHDKRVWANAKGISQACIVCLRVEVTADNQMPEQYENISENDDAYMKAWKHMGHNDSPQANAPASEIWKQLALLTAGIVHTRGPVTAQSFSDSLDTSARFRAPNRCTVGRLMGRDYEYAATFEWDSGHDGGGDFFTTVYWVNRQTTFNTNGYYESYDNYRFYDDPAKLPAKPSRDTGSEGVDIPKQKKIGIDPWDSCRKFPNYR